MVALCDSAYPMRILSIGGLSVRVVVGRALQGKLPWSSPSNPSYSPWSMRVGPRYKYLLVCTHRIHGQIVGSLYAAAANNLQCRILRMHGVNNVYNGVGHYIVSCIGIEKVVDHLKVRGQLFFMTGCSSARTACFGAEGGMSGISNKSGRIT